MQMFPSDWDTTSSSSLSCPDLLFHGSAAAMQDEKTSSVASYGKFEGRSLGEIRPDTKGGLDSVLQMIDLELLGIPESVNKSCGKDLFDVNGPNDRGTLGIHIALNSDDSTLRPQQVQSVVRGSWAHAQGEVIRGDTIVAIDGEEVNEANIIQKVRGTGSIGSRSTLTLSRDGERRDVKLIRTSVNRLQTVEAICQVLAAHEDIVSGGSVNESFYESMDRIGQSVLKLEQNRAEGEAVVMDVVGRMKQEVSEKVNRIRDMVKDALSQIDAEVKFHEERKKRSRAQMEETSRLVLLLENKTLSLKQALEQSMGESQRLQAALDQAASTHNSSSQSLENQHKASRQSLEEQHRANCLALEGQLKSFSGEREELKAAVRNFQWERERMSIMLKDAVHEKAAEAEQRSVLQREAQISKATMAAMEAKIRDLEAALEQRQLDVGQIQTGTNPRSPRSPSLPGIEEGEREGPEWTLRVLLEEGERRAEKGVTVGDEEAALSKALEASGLGLVEAAGLLRAFAGVDSGLEIGKGGGGEMKVNGRGICLSPQSGMTDSFKLRRDEDKARRLADTLHLVSVCTTSDSNRVMQHVREGVRAGLLAGFRPLIELEEEVQGLRERVATALQEKAAGVANKLAVAEKSTPSLTPDLGSQGAERTTSVRAMGTVETLTPMIISIHGGLALAQQQLDLLRDENLQWGQSQWRASRAGSGGSNSTGNPKEGGVENTELEVGGGVSLQSLQSRVTALEVECRARTAEAGALQEEVERWRSIARDKVERAELDKEKEDNKRHTAVVKTMLKENSALDERLKDLSEQLQAKTKEALMIKADSERQLAATRADAVSTLQEHGELSTLLATAPPIPLSSVCNLLRHVRECAASPSTALQELSLLIQKLAPKPASVFAFSPSSTDASSAPFGLGTSTRSSKQGTSVSEVTALLEVLEGPPWRHLSEARHVIETMNMSQPLSAAAFEVIRDALSSHQIQPEGLDAALTNSSQPATLCPIPSDHEEVDDLRKQVVALKKSVSTLSVPAAPIFYPPGGVLAQGDAVVIISPSPSTLVYFTMDDSEPSIQNYLEVGQSPLKLKLNTPCTLRALCVAEADATPSPIASQRYTVD